MRVKTVKINIHGAPCILNETDFNPKLHKLWKGAAVPVQPEPEIENDVVIEHKGGGRWVVTVNGQSVHEGFLKKGAAQALAAEY